MRPWPNSSEPLYYGVNLNNNCPSCGALYNVAAKDIGRRLKCKKCNTALTVTEAGLVVDDEDAPRGTNARALPDEADGEPVVKKKKSSGPGLSLSLDPIGGIPGVLFGTGVFFILFFTFLQVLSVASDQRAAEYEKRLALDEKVSMREKLPKGKNDASELSGDEKKNYDDAEKKIREEYAPRKKVANEDKQYTEIGNKRSKLYEGYGAMFGFMLLSVGCLGFLLTERALLLRIVAGFILTGMVLGLFKLAVGAAAGFNAGVGIG